MSPSITAITMAQFRTLARKILRYEPEVSGQLPANGRLFRHPKNHRIYLALSPLPDDSSDLRVADAMPEACNEFMGNGRKRTRSVLEIPVVLDNGPAKAVFFRPVKETPVTIPEIPKDPELGFQEYLRRVVVTMSHAPSSRHSGERQTLVWVGNELERHEIQARDFVQWLHTAPGMLQKTWPEQEGLVALPEVIQDYLTANLPQGLIPVREAAGRLGLKPMDILKARTNGSLPDGTFTVRGKVVYIQESKLREVGRALIPSESGSSVGPDPRIVSLARALVKHIDDYSVAQGFIDYIGGLPEEQATRVIAVLNRLKVVKKYQMKVVAKEEIDPETDSEEQVEDESDNDDEFFGPVRTALLMVDVTKKMLYLSAKGPGELDMFIGRLEALDCTSRTPDEWSEFLG